MAIQDSLISKYGNPFTDIKAFEARSMVYWDIPEFINKWIPPLPNKLYCNKDFVKPLENVFNKLISNLLHTEIKTFDGCFNVRMIRGSKKVMSIHSFGLAIDLNAAHNPLGLTYNQCISNGLIPFTEQFNSVWRMAGFTLGADFKTRKDGMHFEFTKWL